MKAVPNESGFSKLFLLVAVSIIVLGVVFVFVMRTFKAAEFQSAEQHTVALKECSQTPRITSPVMVEEIRSLTYPGQTRGGKYFTDSVLTVKSPVNEVAVSLPLAAKLIEGRKYVEQGEEQYTLVFETECNIRLRYDHLAVLSPHLAERVSQLPLSPENSAAMVALDGNDTAKGEILASRVGIFKNNTAVMGFGMYDYNQNNKASKSSDWLADPARQTEDARHGVCWLDNLVVSDQTTVKLLSAKDGSTQVSDYCTI
jgi:hypothetical protein